MAVMKEMLEAHPRRVEHDKAGFAVRLYPFTRKRELDEPRIVVIDPFILICRLVVASTGIVTAIIGFAFCRRGTYEASVSTTVGERSKAPSPLRSAGAVQGVTRPGEAVFATGLLAERASGYCAATAVSFRGV